MHGTPRSHRPISLPLATLSSQSLINRDDCARRKNRNNIEPTHESHRNTNASILLAPTLVAGPTGPACRRDHAERYNTGASHGTIQWRVLGITGFTPVSLPAGDFSQPY